MVWLQRGDDLQAIAVDFLMNTQALKVIITGTTGMVGEGVLHECLLHTDVAEVLIVNRRPLGLTHPKLKEIIHTDFYDLSNIEEQLRGYDGCLFCLGVSSVGMSQADYYQLTYTLTLHWGQTLSRINPSSIFCYVSGVGTDNTKQGRVAWARVKGKTENDLAKLAFGMTYGFRPGFIKPTIGLKNTHKYYKYVGWMYPIGRLIAPNSFCTMQELGKAMIKCLQVGYNGRVVSGKDIIKLAKD